MILVYSGSLTLIRTDDTNYKLMGEYLKLIFKSIGIPEKKYILKKNVEGVYCVLIKAKYGEIFSNKLKELEKYFADEGKIQTLEKKFRDYLDFAIKNCTILGVPLEKLGKLSSIGL